MSDKIKAIIFNKVQGSFVDGWGVRTTIFLKGCPLKCKWCCNPEGQSFKPELKFVKEDCDGCGRCVELCPEHAIRMENGNIVIDRERCNVCGECADFCYRGALEPFGTYYTIDEMVSYLKKDKPFYDATGGGVTIGGGEVTWFPDFVLPLIDRLHEEGIQVAADTCGYVATEEGRQVLKNADLVLFDIKGLNREKHKENTGVYNDLIWENLRMLGKIDKPIIVRLPIIPGYNDEFEDIVEISNRLAEIPSIKRIDVLPYHRYGVSKYDQIGMEYTIPEDIRLEESKQKAIVELFSGKGIPTQIGG